MPKDNIDYSNTIIYKINCKDESIKEVYVGHTTNFSQRKYAHKISSEKDKNLRIHGIIRENGGWDNWDMIEIAKYVCKDSTEARIKEQEHFNSLQNTNENEQQKYWYNVTNPKAFRKNHHYYMHEKSYKNRIGRKNKSRKNNKSRKH